MQKILLLFCLLGTMNVYSGLFQGMRDKLGELRESLASFRTELESAELPKPTSKNEPASQLQDNRVAQLEKELDTMKNINKDLLSKFPKPGQEDPLAKKVTELNNEIDKLTKQIAKGEDKNERATKLVNEYTKVMQRQQDELEEKNKEIRSCKARLLKAEATLNPPIKSK